MQIAVFGTGFVGQTIAARLAGLGHAVMLGTRDVSDLMTRQEPAFGTTQSFAEWIKQNQTIQVGDYATAAAHGELVFNATSGTGSLDALATAGEETLNGKLLIDLANPLDFSRGMPPSLSVSNTDSLGEQIQRAFPNVRVVKTLNTVNGLVMVNPRLLADGDHTMFVAGNDAAAKARVTTILQDWFGWKHVLDLGDITSARGMEMYLPLWLRLFSALGTPMYNIKVIS